MKIAEVLRPDPTSLWALVRQCGIEHVVGGFPRPASGDDLSGAEKPWHLEPLRKAQAAYSGGGFELAVIEARPPMEKIKLGLPGRDEEIDEVCALIRAMGELGIPVWCYEWMPVLNWIRTDLKLPSRGGALVTGFDIRDSEKMPTIDVGDLTEDKLWENLEYFLRKVVPVAEESGVSLAMHPDDPPISPVRGTPRIMRSIVAYDRLLDLVPSSVNGVALCQGNFTLMTEDLPEAIRHFGSKKKIFFVHFRDVQGTAEHYQETFHDIGKTDMAECVRAYRDVGFDGICRPDHVPTMEGDNNDRPGYSSIGRLFAIGYIRGLIHAVYGKEQ
jgi:mannonate dehydratase